MLNKLLSLLLILFVVTSTVPADSAPDKPYLAVFANPGTRKLISWDKFHPDYYVETGDWELLDPFLEIVKKKAGNRPLVIDIECHGDPTTGMLVLEYSAFGQSLDDTASSGWLLTKINKYFDNKKNLDVCLEACYSRVVISKDYKANIESEDFHTAPMPAQIKYPVYGIGDTPNYDNTVFLQYHYGIRPYFEDLRQYIGKDVKPNFDKLAEKAVLALCVLLESYGI